MCNLIDQLVNKTSDVANVAMIIIADDSHFVAANLNNFLWVTFTRTNPSHDIYGVKAFVQSKHWGCYGPLIIDARIKPHHAPPVEKDSAVEKKIDSLFKKSGSLYGVLK
jgi:4-hydroxy-3-polyprenylbenzoate decarboxylase